jgi:hypothetical protein
MIRRLLECLCDLYPRLSPEHQRGVVHLCQFLRPERIEIAPSHIRWLKHLGHIYPEAKGYYQWMRFASPRIH